MMRARAWIAAGRLRLGLGLGNVRSCSSLGAGTEKNAYLVFDELKVRSLSEEKRWEMMSQSYCSRPGFRSSMELDTIERTYVVRRILVDTDDDEDEEVVLPVEAYCKSDKFHEYSTNCTTLGSKIVIPLISQLRFKHIAWVDTSKSPSPMKFQVSSRTGFDMRSFRTPKYNLQLGEIDGKLYCIDFGRSEHRSSPFCSIHRNNSFEVFDPNSPLLWRVLDFPCFLYHLHIKHIAFLPEIKKILIFAVGGSHCFDVGSYCFDVTKPKAGWKKFLSATPEPDHYAGGFKVGCPPLFIHNYHPAIGDHYAVFELRSGTNPSRSSCIEVHFMSATFELSQPVNRFIQLPELCSHYLFEKRKRYTFCDESDDEEVSYTNCHPFSYKFIHLGDKKFGLVMNKAVKDKVNKIVQDINKGSLLLVTYSYDINVTTCVSKPKLEIETKLLGTRRFQYETPDICSAELIGAFMM